MDSVHDYGFGGGLGCVSGCGVQVDAMSQKQRIANLLRDGPVCGTALLDLRMPRYAARISELRAEGMLIETRVCESHRHASKQIEYVVLSPSLF